MLPSQQKYLAFRIYRARDPEAYRLLYRACVRGVHRFLALKLPREEDVDELSSEVFLRGWEYMTAHMVDSPRAFFMRIAHNLVVDFYRKSDRTVALSEEIIETLAEPTSLAETIAKKEEATELVEKMRGLREEYREVLTLKYFSEMSVLEIAEALQRTPNAIRILIFRALRALKKL